MGMIHKCSSCRFSFLTGHRHHEGSSKAICIECLQEYIIKTERPWGPSLNEECQLLYWVQESKRKGPNL